MHKNMQDSYSKKCRGAGATHGYDFWSLISTKDGSLLPRIVWKNNYIILDTKYLLEHTKRKHVGLRRSHFRSYSFADFKTYYITMIYAQDEVGTTKHNWAAWCQYNVSGWGSMWAYDMLPH